MAWYDTIVANLKTALEAKFVSKDDSRLTDARTPTSHTHTKSEINDFNFKEYIFLRMSIQIISKSISHGHLMIFILTHNIAR